jgi:hypothetical protein
VAVDFTAMVSQFMPLIVMVMVMMLVITLLKELK